MTKKNDILISAAIILAAVVFFTAFSDKNRETKTSVHDTTTYAERVDKGVVIRAWGKNVNAEDVEPSQFVVDNIERDIQRLKEAGEDEVALAHIYDGRIWKYKLNSVMRVIKDAALEYYESEYDIKLRDEDIYYWSQKIASDANAGSPLNTEISKNNMFFTYRLLDLYHQDKFRAMAEYYSKVETDSDAMITPWEDFVEMAEFETPERVGEVIDLINHGRFSVVIYGNAVETVMMWHRILIETGYCKKRDFSQMSWNDYLRWYKANSYKFLLNKIESSEELKIFDPELKDKLKEYLENEIYINT
jgi:hypothetical protein